MEKFALLNLLKAIDGLKNAGSGEKTPSPPPPPAERESGKNELPNIIYGQLLKHEIMSNRLKNKK